MLALSARPGRLLQVESVGAMVAPNRGKSTLHSFTDVHTNRGEGSEGKEVRKRTAMSSHKGW
jgi:hypothetical protein